MLNRLRSESWAPIFAFGAAFAIMGAQVGARATRDALYLSTFPVESLPLIMFAAAGLSLGSAVLLSLALARISPVRFIPLVFLGSALLFVGEWALLRVAPKLAAVVLYLHPGALGAALLSGFWSVLNERFDPYSGKTILARAGAFSALGGMVGGLVAERVGVMFGLPPMLFVLAGLHVLCAFGVLAVGSPKSRSARRRTTEAGESGFAILRRVPLLRSMAILCVVLAVMNATIEYAFKAAAAGAYPDEAALIRFFALFEVVVSGAAFLLQATVVSALLQRLGLGWAMALRPAAVLVTAVLGVALARFWTAVLARAADVVSTATTFRTGFELLYTPLPVDQKRPTKAYIDIGANRVGEMLGSALVLGVVALVPGVPRELIFSVAAISAGVGLVLVVQLQRGYVSQLAENLRAGVVTLDDPSATLDAVTARTIWTAREGGIDRDDLMAQIAAVREQQAQDRAAREAAKPDARALAEADAQRQKLFEWIGALESGDHARVRKALGQSGDDLRLVPFAIALLGRRKLGDEALKFLYGVAPQIVGQLTDALLDPERPVRLRRSIPGILERARGTRAVESLALGLEDPDAEVRIACGRAASRIIAREASLKLRAERVYALVDRELHTRTRDGFPRTRRADEEPALLERGEASRVDRRVEHVFTMLSLALGPELMAATLRSLHGDDAHLRGTALEYLQATLPDALRLGLWPLLPATGRPTRADRPQDQIADEIMRTSANLRLDGES